MERVVGIFESIPAARTAYDQFCLEHDGRVHLLVPGDEPQLQQLRATELARPKIGQALWTVTGASAGVLIGVAIGFLIVPAGLAASPFGFVCVGAAALAGAIVGGVCGSLIERRLEAGLPPDCLFVYENALRHGHAVLAVDLSNAQRASAVREMLASSDAISLEGARDQWWDGLRNTLASEERACGYDFRPEEQRYRQGFEAAQRRVIADYPDEQALFYLRDHCQPDCNYTAFLRGFQRGLVYRHAYGAAQADAPRARGSQEC